MSSDISEDEYADMAVDMVSDRDFVNDNPPQILEAEDAKTFGVETQVGTKRDTLDQQSDQEDEEDSSSRHSKRQKTNEAHSHMNDDPNENEKEEVDDLDDIKIADPSDFVSKKLLEQKEESLYVKTLNVSDFCVQIQSICTIPNIESILMKFDEEGMTIYARPKQSPSIAICFWNRKTFEKYECQGTIQKWVNKDRLASLKKKISKDVKYLEISLCESSPGFCFSGFLTYAQGDGGNFTHNIHEWVSPEPPLKIPCVYKWHISTSSKQFKDNVDFIDEKNEFIGLNIKEKKMIFRGLVGAGDVVDMIDHTTFTSSSKEFYVLFYKKYLKAVTSAHGLNKSITISFSDETQYVPPVLFSYALDKEKPQSHFSVYIVPIPKQM